MSTSPSDDAPGAIVQGHPAPERDDATGNLPFTAAQSTGPGQEVRRERVGLIQTVERMARLGERVEHGGGQREDVEAEGIGRVCLGLGDRLAAGPGLARIARRGDECA